MNKLTLQDMFESDSFALFAPDSHVRINSGSLKTHFHVAVMMFVNC